MLFSAIGAGATYSHNVYMHIRSVPPNKTHPALFPQSVQIKAGALHAFAVTFPQPDSHIGFIGAFVFTKAHIPVNFKQALVDFRNRLHLGRNFPEFFPHGSHKFPGRMHDKLIVIFPVFFKPFFGIIFLQLIKKYKILPGKNY